MEIDGKRAAELRRQLLRWYDRCARRLPWRETRDPYRIWISEAMLQQTRVETAIPYWERFLEQLPKVEDLALAEERDLLALWSGLGYYRRVRSLQAAARVVVDQHAGQFPTDKNQALALPGVGPYTAGAVLSIAYDQAVALVDGNVLRVFARLFALEHALDSGELKRKSWGLAEALLPRRSRTRKTGPGAWNQALMELGATLCKVREPDCANCPLANFCLAKAQGKTAQLPLAPRRKSATQVQLEQLVVLNKAGLLLVERPAKGRMAGLWELPTRECSKEPATHLYPSGYPEIGANCGWSAGRELGEIRHGITRYRIRATVRLGRLEGRLRPAGSLRRVALASLERAPLTGMTRKALGLPGVQEALGE